MSTTTSTADDGEQDVWEQLEAKRDVFEMIIEEDGPFAPHAENVLTALDEHKRGEDA